MSKSSATTLLAAALSLTPLGMAQAAGSEVMTTAKGAVVRCGGNHFSRLGNSEIHFFSYNLKNFNSVEPITIDRVRIFDAQGNTIWDSDSQGMPPTDNGIIGGSDNVIGPNMTTNFTTLNLQLPLLPATLRPLQMELSWSAAKSVLALSVGGSRIVRGWNFSGPILEERARASSQCTTILLK